MAAFVKYESFIDELSKAGHNLQTCTYKLALTNTAPNVSTHLVWNTTNAPEPVAAITCTAGGNTVAKTSAATTTRTFKRLLVMSVFTAPAGGSGPFLYSILYNS